MKINFIAVFILLSLPVLGQDYYPLQVGNTWYLDWAPSKIVGTQIINNKEYFLYLNSHMQRVDEHGNVVEWANDSTEIILYKLNAIVGESWSMELNSGGFQIFRNTTLESRTDIVQTNDTVFNNCLRYSITFSNVFDADYKIWLAPNVGIVKSKNMGWGLDSSQLIKALVNNIRIPAKKILPEIKETMPKDMGKNIPTDAEIAIHFNFKVRDDLVNQENITISSSKNGTILYHFINPYSTEVRIAPNTEFENDDTISVKLSERISDYMDDHLAEDFSMEFYTESKIEDPGIFIEDTISQISNLKWGDFDFADYDKDGDLDLILAGVVDSVDSGIEPKIELYNNVSGNFVKSEIAFNTVRTDFTKNSIKWVDFDNDELLDIVFCGVDKNLEPLTQFYKNQNNLFVLQPQMNLNFGYAQMEWFDFNKDGYQDLFIQGNTKPENNDIFIFRNEGNKFVKYSSLHLESFTPGFHKCVDFNLDGALDIIETGQQLSDTKFFQNNNQIFSDANIKINEQHWLPYQYNMDFTDIDGDNDVDLAFGPIILYREGNTFIPDYDQIELDDAFLQFFDFNKDSYDDVFVIGTNSDNVGKYRTYIQVYENTHGRMDLLYSMRLNVYHYLFSAHWLDLNNDSKPDLVAMTSEGFKIYYNIMKTTDVKKPDPLISNFSLSKNFPNPFNPVTKIKYSIPVETRHSAAGGSSLQNVTLKIYDILGNEVATLVNKEQPAGEYEVEFNGSKLSSGIYFYNLNIEGNQISGKMCLIK